MTEKERIEKVMQLEGMNSVAFAGAINIQGSTLSHILNGRNNPSLGVMQNILNRFPNISPEWLIMGQGSVEKGLRQSQEPTLFDPVNESVSKSETFEQKIAEKNDTTFSANQQKNSLIPQSPVQTVQEPVQPAFIPQAEATPKSVRKIIVYYTDNTFQEFETR